MKRKGQIWITVICIMLGVILTAQLRTQAGIRNIPTKRIEEMASLLKQAESGRMRCGPNCTNCRPGPMRF